MKISTLLTGLKLKFYAFIRPFFTGGPRLPRRWDSPGDYLDFQYDTGKHSLCITCTGGIFLITAGNEGIFKITLYRPEDPELPSLSVLSFPNLPLMVAEREKGILSIHTKENPALVCFFNTRELTISFRKEGKLLLQEVSAPGISKGWVTTSFRAPSRQKFVGFGQKTGGLFKNNHKMVMWNTDDSNIGKNSDPLYQSCPLQIGLGEDGTAWGLYFDNTHRNFFFPGTGNPEDCSTYAAEKGPLTYYFLSGPGIREVVQQYTSLTGTYPLPPRWVLGHHHSRWEDQESAERVILLAESFRKHEIPCDVIHLDIGHMEGYRCFTWNRNRFPSPAEVITKLHAAGFKVVVIVDPGLKKDEKWDLYKEGIREDVFCYRKNGKLYHGPVWPGESVFVNFLSDKASQWWGDRYKVYTDLGIDGFWNDMNEPAIFRPRNTMKDDVIFRTDDGRTYNHRTIHNIYGLLMTKASVEGIRRLRPEKRPFLFSRSSFAGSQRYGSTWTGDNSSNWDHLRMSIPMLLNMGLSGQVFSGPDTGGFWQAPTRELMIRWIQLATFYAFSRNHTSLGTPPQEFWSMGDEVLQQARQFISLRYKLLPYLYTQLEFSCRSGVPFLKPLFFDFPLDKECLTEQYAESQFICGSDLLIAPVLEEKCRERAVYLPQDCDWVHWETGKFYAGGKSHTIPAPLESLPFFVKSGSVIPVGNVALKSEEVFKGPLTFEIFPARHMEGKLYLDDGETVNHTRGDFSLLTCTGTTGKENLTLDIRQTAGNSQPEMFLKQGLKFHIHWEAWQGAVPLNRISINGKQLTPDRFTRSADRDLTIMIDTVSFPLKLELSNSH